MIRRSLIISVLFLLLSPLPARAGEISIREWDLPTPDSLPHDPAVGTDGALWYTGMLANLIGRLDPATGHIEEYPLPKRDSGPHGLVSDKDGNIWFTANARAYIGKLNPATDKITEYPMPDPAARDPHTPVFDADGMLWFTVQIGNFVGRLDPGSGKITLIPSPTPSSRPYGIIVNHRGYVFYCELGANKIGRVDPVTLQIKEYVLPVGARPRRLALGKNGIIYYTDYRRGFLGALDPATDAVREWPSPGGSESRPYGIAVTPDGTVWYSESGVHPNTIVLFDPVKVTFQSVKVPSGGGVIRNMAATPGGDVYIACSGVNKVGIVRRVLKEK